MIHNSVRDLPGLFCQGCSRSVPVHIPLPLPLPSSAIKDLAENSVQIFGSKAVTSKIFKTRQLREIKRRSSWAAPSFIHFYIKRSIFGGGNGTTFMTLYLDGNHGVAGNQER